MKHLILITFLFAILASNAQDPTRFKDQVNELFNAEYNFSPDKKLVVFTGSSSVRKWEDVQERFPGYNVINNGFGGSHFSDLLYYYNELITKQTPDFLFVYEGDNDVAGEKKTSKIYKDAKTLVKKLQRDLPSTKVVFIAPKPSVARWHLKKEYTRINKKLKKLCKKTDGFVFADVWQAMLDENGMVYQDIFVEDNLHMNSKGYDIWTKVIVEFLE
ncbi:GDSL-type esterase/lipase family protein [Draconibacterium sp.]|nr:GDSL-type esterase/lipase family protein [Draconibacterium sp.]